ncbi:NFACT family protein [Cloacibacillus sp. An23]|uniref:NFACT family protein n=1 Tax=Cloacibacillus sp. An23 TaxID=1965591 RepID=UPI000B383726|nr:NFACT family protein [Cloacibacillus sp. An23]OUO92238.1 hypothetical protein B5F39_11435 [Cloacibacillus sp. An23]
MSFGPELIWSWSRELSALAGRRAQRVDGGGSAVIISLAGGAELLLSWGAQNCGAAVISAGDKKSLLAAARQTPPIANAVKSHLTGAQLVSVAQLHRDRILEFTFRKTIGAGFSTERRLVLEIMERFSNLVITDENGTIIETAKHVHPADNSFRTVLPGVPYHMPPLFGGTPLEEWLAEPRRDTLMKVAGVGRPLLKLLAAYPAALAAEYLRGLYCDSGAPMTPQRIGKYVTALPGLLPDAEKLPDGSTYALIALAPMKDGSIESRRKNIVKHIEKEITRRERQLGDIRNLLTDGSPARFKLWGELIVANMWNIKHGAAEAELAGYDDAGNEISRKVPLDPRLSPSQNSAAYFAKYKKITSAQERASSLVRKVEEELDELREELALASSIDEAQALVMLEEELGMSKTQNQKRGGKKEPQLPPHVRFEFEKAIVCAGLSAKGNRWLTFRFASPDDWWFHAQGVPGAHVVLRAADTLTSEEFGELAAFCASLAVFYSKAKNEPRHRVDYTRRKYVSPIRGGEANVTYKEFSSITGEPSLWSEKAPKRD